jgi:hypothetical protein
LAGRGGTRGDAPVAFSVRAPPPAGSKGEVKPVAVKVAPEAVKASGLLHASPGNPATKAQGPPPLGARSPKKISVAIAEPALPATSAAATAIAKTNLFIVQLLMNQWIHPRDYVKQYAYHSTNSSVIKVLDRTSQADCQNFRHLGGPEIGTIKRSHIKSHVHLQ